MGSREGQEFRVTSGSLIPASESPLFVPMKGTDQGQVRGLRFGCRVFEVPQDRQGRLPGAAGSLGQEPGERDD